MVEKTSRALAPHYSWGDDRNPCDGWHLLREEELSVIEERMPPATQDQRHFHERSRQMFYVLAGELTMVLEGITHTLASGEALAIAPGAPHQAVNRSEADVLFLVVSSPPTSGDRHTS